MTFPTFVSAPFFSIAHSITKPSGLPLPRFVSLRSEKVNLRTGPGVNYPIDWVYKRFYESSLFNGVTNKVLSIPSNKRTLAVTGQTRTLRKNPNTKSGAVARVEPGVVGLVKVCPDRSGWCQLSIGKYQGWLRRAEFWGVYPSEKIK